MMAMTAGNDSVLDSVTLYYRSMSFLRNIYISSITADLGS